MAGKAIYQALCGHIKETRKKFIGLMLASESTQLCLIRAKILFNWITGLNERVEHALLAELLRVKDAEIAILTGLLHKKNEENTRQAELLHEKDDEIARLTGLLRKRAA